MPNKNEPKPSFWPEKAKHGTDEWDHACGCDILSNNENVYQGGPGRTKKTDQWEEKDKSDAYGN